MRLGEQLVKSGLIPEGRVLHALEVQKRTGGRLGDILISKGMIGYFDLYRTLAKSQSFAFADLLKHPPSQELLDPLDMHDYLRLLLIPWRNERGITTVALCDFTDEAIAWVKARYGSHARLVMTSPLDIRRTVEATYGVSLERASCLSLWRNLPHVSARHTFTLNQKQVITGGGFLALALALYQPSLAVLAIILLCQLTYTMTLMFKCWVFNASAHPPAIKRRSAKRWAETLESLDPQSLPIYTILIPMYKEAASLPGMLRTLGKLDYPSHKLDIKLILESDDHETFTAAQKLKPGYQFDIIRVPDGSIRTKPKACNYALKFARGEYVTIFDADDRPERMQLKKAVYTFRNSPPDVVCLQARLNYYNANDNLLTRFFSLEYMILFHFMLRGLEHLRIPIPLGGTSNHMSLKHLLEQGEWDPYNVTEDADLGTRFAARSYRTIMLDSITMEEAPVSVGAWIRQRSRWIKGYMQTWLVHMREPALLLKTLGWKGFIGFQFFIGLSTFTYLSAPVVWVLCVLWIGELLELHSIAFPTWLACLTFTNIFFNLFSQWCFTLNCLPLYRGTTLPIYAAALLFPFYMVLHSIASYKALWQLFVRPHFWEKTTHGISQAARMA